MAALTVAEIKKYLRYEASDTSNDDPLALIVEGGQRYIENFTGHILVQRPVTESPAAFPTARRTGEVPYYDLRWKPFVAETLTVGYLDADYVDATFDDFAIYQTEGTTRVIPTGDWPGEFVGITFTYMAGYDYPEDIPTDLIHALALYCGMSDEDRASPDGWTALENLLVPYRMPVLA